MINWQWKSFDELTGPQVYSLLALRQQVFVIEQQCIYADIDGVDDKAMHLLGYNTQQQLIAYLRIFAPGIQYTSPSIGRIVTDKNNRGLGTGKRLILKAIDKIRFDFPDQPIYISAQHRLLKFYTGLGFTPVGNRYLEDGLEHIQMILHQRTRIEILD